MESGTRHAESFKQENVEDSGGSAIGLIFWRLNVHALGPNCAVGVEGDGDGDDASCAPERVKPACYVQCICPLSRYAVASSSFAGHKL